MTGTDVMDVVMALVMAEMLAGSTVGSIWAVTFGLAALWFLWRAVRAYVLSGAREPAIGHHVRHGVLCAAMVYMVAGAAVPATAAPVAMASMSGMGDEALPPFLLGVLLVGLIGIGGWDIYRLARPLRAVSVPVVAPRVAICWQLALSGAMAYLLVVT